MMTSLRAFAFLILLTCFAGFQKGAAAEECTAFSGNGVNNWYPFSYRTEEGHLTGVMVDGMREALKRVGLKLTIQVDRPWKRIIYDLENAHVDMVLGAYWNSERAEKFHYSEAMGTDELRIFVKSGKEFTFHAFADLIGRSGMHLLGGSLGDEFDTFSQKHLDLQEVPQSDAIITMLQNDRADYGILGYVEGLKFIHTQKLEGEITALPKAILANAMHVMISKEATCAHKLEAVNQAIKDMKTDGTLDRILNDHLKKIADYAQ
ncbi:transporter substrate-binding domain-containing protein [Terasakiella sp. A23]|uniref:substrate-binding periplasmic protein n=1 Tax=Terasakiella sp. FCG-A23 TaxID=3080561 RepID=UPI002952977A|nr:transporter substrate-binding domain-containing protein [Terasakiella sp. A23]MDV7338097.1 transporter substrate-binding domain-containing protein [Terasakiella sp. A23]